MFGIMVEFDDGPMIIEVATFDQMWEIKEWFEAEGFDVDWDYEP